MVVRLDRHVETTPGTRGGQPRIAGTRIAVSDIVIMHLRLGESLAQIAGDYDLQPAAVHAALEYYYDHRDEIDRRIDEVEAFAKAFRDNCPSLLHAKLKSLRGH